MKLKLVIVLLLIVLVPLGLMAWLGSRVARSERAAVEDSFRKLHMQKLKDVEATILKVVGLREREMLALADSLALDPGALRAAARNNPAVSQIFEEKSRKKKSRGNRGTEVSIVLTNQEVNIPPSLKESLKNVPQPKSHPARARATHPHTHFIVLVYIFSSSVMRLFAAIYIETEEWGFFGTPAAGPVGATPLLIDKCREVVLDN